MHCNIVARGFEVIDIFIAYDAFAVAGRGLRLLTRDFLKFVQQSIADVARGHGELKLFVILEPELVVAVFLHVFDGSRSQSDA